MQNAPKKSRFTFAALAAALRQDGKILMKNTEGRAAPNPKTMAIGAGTALGALLLLGMATGFSGPQNGSSLAQAKTPAQTDSQIETQAVPDIDMAKTQLAALTDFRGLNGEQESKAKTLNLKIKSGQSLGPLLQSNGVAPETAYAATQAFASVHDPRLIKAGQNVSLYFGDSDSGFTGLSMKPNTESTVFVSKSPGGDFHSRLIHAEFEKDVVRVKGKIENSLYLDAGAKGAPDKVIVQFSHIYAHSVDFQRDIQPGDAYELVFEVYRDHKGNTVKAGDLIFTSFSPRGKTANYYLFESPGGNEGFYDEKGKGAKRMLMRTPVSGARLSSSYGRRKHPVLGYRKLHKGVDFAAPTGTPIMAAGTGTVQRAGRWSSYGNYIRIKHSDGYSTAYAHLSKFARGVRAGKRVIQGQTIGYVGATGRVTGAHLHYEVLKNGRQINPMTLSTLSGKPIKSQDLPAFKQRVVEIDKLRANLPLDSAPQGETPVLAASADVPLGTYVLLPQN